MMQGAASQHKTSFTLQMMFALSSSKLLAIYSNYRHICLYSDTVHSIKQAKFCSVWSLTKADRIESKMQVTNSKTWLTNAYEIYNRRWTDNQKYFAAGEHRWPAL